MAGDWTFEPSGDVDIARAEQLRAEWYAVVDEWEPDRVIIDLRQTGFLDGYGLSVLSGLTKRQREHEGVVAVRNASPLVVQVMKAVGLADSVQILKTSA
jgi:anti-anti-sigma factor